MTSAAPFGPPASSLEGTLIGGKFRLERVLGEGGMGVVYAAVHLDLRKHVAIKLIRDELAANPEVVERMLNEARIAASLRSEHVARVLDVGTLESGAPFIVMEYLEGADLATMLAAEGPLGARSAVDYVLQACEAVAEAHAAGIVHRDIKPDNVFIASGADGEPMAKVLDFGVSKVLVGERETSALTNPSSLIGSPSYMAPESMQNSEQAGPAADVWSLGAVLYELLSGVRPFDGNNLPETCAKVLATEPAPLRDFAPSIPAALETVVQRCLVKDPERRLSVLELATALAPFASPEAAAIVRRIERVASGVRLKPRSIVAGARIVTPASSMTPHDSMPPATVRESREPAASSTRKLQVRVAGGLALGACVVLTALGLTLSRSSEASQVATARGGVAARTDAVLRATSRALEAREADASATDEAREPGAQKTSAAKPIEAKPVEARPIDPKPIEAKPIDPKPIDAKPIDARPRGPASKSRETAGAAKHPVRAAPESAASAASDVYPSQETSPQVEATPQSEPPVTPPAAALDDTGSTQPAPEASTMPAPPSDAVPPAN